MKNLIKIMKAKPEVSEEEIQRYMDFDMLIEKRASLLKQKSTTLKVSSILVGAMAIAILGWMYLPFEDADHTLNKNDSVEVIDKSTTEDFSPVDEENPTEQNNNTIIDKLVPEKKVETKSKLSDPKEVEKGKIDEPNTDEKLSIEYDYKEAEPVNGYSNLYEYFNSELKYPDEALKDSIQGVVTVSFTINKLGDPEKIKIENSLGEHFDKEAIRLIQNMPSWKSATVNNKPISSQLSIPLTFQIQKVKTKK